MTRYLLDSNILEYLQNGDSLYHTKCVDQFTCVIQKDLCVSLLTIYELDYSIAAASESLALELKQTRIDILDTFTLLPLSLIASPTYARLKSAYKTQFQSKTKAMKSHTVDVILAATAIEYDAVMVSADHIFAQLQSIEPKLRVENWAES